MRFLDTTNMVYTEVEDGFVVKADEVQFDEGIELTDECKAFIVFNQDYVETSLFVLFDSIEDATEELIRAVVDGYIVVEEDNYFEIDIDEYELSTED